MTSKYHREGAPRLDQSQDPERDALIVALRTEGLSFKTIGEGLGLTRQRVTQLYNRATAPEPEVPKCWCGTPLTREVGVYQAQGGRPANPEKYCTPEHVLKKPYVRNPDRGPYKRLRPRKFTSCAKCMKPYASPRSSNWCRSCAGQAEAVIRSVNYAEMAARQESLCAICHSPETATGGNAGKIRRLAVDHCHETGAVRELVCMRCNLLIGSAEENPEILESAASYLRKHRK